jgi:toxin ParE1/3/4
MSSPNYPLILSDLAQADYEDILAYTLRTWGARQHAIYADVLDEALRALQDDPQRGHHHRQLPERYRYVHVERHLIVYRFTQGTVYVVRLLHDRMDVPRHIEEAEEEALP